MFSTCHRRSVCRLLIINLILGTFESIPATIQSFLTCLHFTKNNWLLGTLPISFNIQINLCEKFLKILCAYRSLWTKYEQVAQAKFTKSKKIASLRWYWIHNFCDKAYSNWCFELFIRSLLQLFGFNGRIRLLGFWKSLHAFSGLLSIRDAGHVCSDLNRCCLNGKPILIWSPIDITS